TTAASCFPAPAANASSVRWGESAMILAAGAERWTAMPRPSWISKLAGAGVASAAKASAAACSAEETKDLTLVFHVAHQFRAGLAQARGEHGDELHEDLRAKLRLLENDLRHVVAREHAEGRRLRRAAR